MDLGNLDNASVQYNDLVGSVAVDFEGSPDDFEKYAKQNGIDTKKYEPVGINLYGGRGEFSTFEIFCVDRKDYPIAEDGEIPVIAFAINDSFDNLLMNLKRIHVLLHEKFYKTSQYKVVKTIDSDGTARH